LHGLQRAYQVGEHNATPVVVALPTTAEGYAYSNGSAVRFGGYAAHKVSFFLQHYISTELRYCNSSPHLRTQAFMAQLFNEFYFAFLNGFTFICYNKVENTEISA